MSKSKRAEAEFAPKTRELAARRAGYRCSLPTCHRQTVGPGAQPEDFVCIGKAAHIYSAAPGGPRGAGGLSPEERRSVANAIWLCSDHADLVDKNRGTDYPPGLLLSYKDIHEARIARELGGVFETFGWVESLHVHSSPLLYGTPKIELGKLTLLIGENGTGKTALCEWLASISAPRHLRRWERVWKNRDRVDVEVGYLDPEEHKARVSFLSGDHPRYYLDDRFTAVPTAPVKIVFPSDLRFKATAPTNDLELIARTLNLDQYEVLALCEDIPHAGTENVTRAWFERQDDDVVLHADVIGTYPGLSLGQLSASECSRVVMEFAIVAACRFSERYPTVLILDGGGWSLDTGWLTMYGEALAAPAMGFQTVAAIPTKDLNLDELRWVGWKVIRLEGKAPGVTVDSAVRSIAGSQPQPRS